MKKLVFGPVPSRRLGFSLGVDLIPMKYCTFDCIYCQLGSRGETACRREHFCEPDLVVEQVAERIATGARIDCISLSGSGEPTLNIDIGRVIKKLKRKTELPVAVITNGSLLHREDVRAELMSADIVLPSLDAASEGVFRKINRPHASCEFQTMVEGLKAFCGEYKGKAWLEIMLLNNINSDTQHINMFRKIVDSVRVDKIHLNTVVRPPAEKTALPVRDSELRSIARLFGPGCEIIAERSKKQPPQVETEGWDEAVLAMLARRSLSLEDIVQSTGVTLKTAREGMKRLTKEGKARAVVQSGRHFYLPAEDSRPSEDA